MASVTATRAFTITYRQSAAQLESRSRDRWLLSMFHHLPLLPAWLMLPMVLPMTLDQHSGLTLGILVLFFASAAYTVWQVPFRTARHSAPSLTDVPIEARFDEWGTRLRCEHLEVSVAWSMVWRVYRRDPVWTLAYFDGTAYNLLVIDVTQLSTEGRDFVVENVRRAGGKV